MDRDESKVSFVGVIELLVKNYFKAIPALTFVATCWSSPADAARCPSELSSAWNGRSEF